MRKQVEEETQQRHASAGTRPLGVAAVMDQDPRARPEVSRHSPAPPCHASTPPLRAAFRAAYRAFVDAFARAAEVLRASKPGAPLPAFPAGSFPPRARSLDHEAPPDTAWPGHDVDVLLGYPPLSAIT